MSSLNQRKDFSEGDPELNATNPLTVQILTQIWAFLRTLERSPG